MIREIEESHEFKQAKKRISKSGRHSKVMQERFAHAVIMLACDKPLDYSYRDHPLIGNLLGYRECHLAFDLVLVYKYIGDDVLLLDKLGSHSDVLGL